ncbi:MAG TPA: hypothetical protein VD761_04405 [Solirubrobacterales bacterium]|nr:hypothetical protein [Solirubrobacterales bacterium]
MGRLGWFQLKPGARLGLIVALVAVLLAVLAAGAGAIRMQAGDIVVSGDGHVIPSKLPKFQNAPIRLKIHGKLGTVSGALPPVLDTMKLEVDGEGEIETEGLPVCRSSQLQSVNVSMARKLCPGSIIGTGTGDAIVAFPEQRNIDVSSPLTLFNGPNSANKWIIYVHAYIQVPVPAAIVIPVKIKRIRNGPYGYEVNAAIPKIAGGSGIPVSAELEVGHTWKHQGKSLSYLNARCEDGRLQARGKFSFKDGTVLNGSFLKPCTVRP